MAKSDKAADSPTTGVTELVEAVSPKEGPPTVMASMQKRVNPPAKVRKFPSLIMYMGPSMTEDGVIYRHGQIFNNGLPETWKMRALQDPEFSRLLVPLNKVGAALSDIKNPQSMLANVNRDVETAYLARRKQSRKGK